MESLGKGLESLIPDKKLEDVSDIVNSEEDSSREQEQEISEKKEEKDESEQENVETFEGKSPPPAKTYEDHFAPKQSGSVFSIEINKIEPNPYQPRREFEEEALKDLAQSIREHGILQPVLVTKREIETPAGLDVRYELIAGERRWRAAQLAGLSQIPALIRRGIPGDRIKLELALIENLQREDLNPLDKALAYRQLIDEFGMVHREIGRKIGKSREAISNSLRLLVLPEEIQRGLSESKISEGHARTCLMAGDDPVNQLQLYKEILTDMLTVREAENRARQISGRSFVPRARASTIVETPEMREWQNKLQEKFGTKVKLQRNGGRGKIVVEFFSDEELRGILGKMILEA